MKQLTSYLHNVQQWPIPSGASTMPISRPNGAARAVVLEAFKGHKTLAQLSSEFGIHAQMITERSGVPVETAGSRRDALSVRDNTQQANPIGRATRTNRSAFISTNWSVEGRKRLPQKKITDELKTDLRSLIDPTHTRLSVNQQCALLGLARSTYYYQPLGESAQNLALLIRE